MRLLVLVTFVLFGLLFAQERVDDFCSQELEYLGLGQQFIDSDDCDRPNNADNVPAYACNEGAVDGDIINAIEQLYPEGKKVVDALIKDKISFTAQIDGYAYITFVKTGAGYKNRLGLYYYDSQGNIKTEKLIFPYVNNFGSDCLKDGDTARVEVEKDVKYGFILYPDYHNDQNKRPIYSDVTMGPDLEAPTGRAHVTWVDVRTAIGGTIVFGFEDKIYDSDLDYNDIMFTLYVQDCENRDDCFEDLPEYEDGNVNECLELETVTSSSYVEKDCFGWALLEKEEENACNFFLKPPPGWNVASVGDRDIIKDISKWYRHVDKKNCFGFMNEVGDLEFYEYDGNTFASCSVRMAEDKENNCFAVHCDYRVVLKTETKLSGDEDEECGNNKYEFCDPNREYDESKLPTFPSKDIEWMVHPHTIDLLMIDGKDFISTELLSVRGDLKNVDVVVAFDLHSLGKSDSSTIMDNFKNVFSRLEDKSELDSFRVAAAGVHSTGFSVTNFASDIDSISSLDGVISRKYGDSEFTDLVKRASACPQCAWREESSTARVIVFVTNKEPPTNIESDVINTVLNNNNIMVFVGGKKGNGEKWDTLQQKFKNSASHYTNDDKFKEYYKKIGDNVLKVLGKSYIHIAKGGDAVMVNEEYPMTLTSEKNFHSFTVNYGDVVEHGVTLATFNLLGRSTTDINIQVNRPPVAQDATVSFSVKDGTTTLSLALEASDPDLGKIKFKVENDNGLEVQVVGKDGDWFENPYIKIVIEDPDPDFGQKALEFTVTDGCTPVNFYVNVIGICDDAECFIPKCHNSQDIHFKKGDEPLPILLSGYYDEHYDGQIIKQVKKISGPSGSVFYNSENDAIEEGDIVDNTIYFSTNSIFSVNDEYVLRYAVFNGEAEGSDVPQNECTVKIIVNPANDPPEYNGETEFYIDEDSFFTFFINDKKIDFEFEVPANLEKRLEVSVVDDGIICPEGDEFNCLSCCNGDGCSGGACSELGSEATFAFRPRKNDYGNDYFNFDVRIKDKFNPSAQEGIFTITIHVNPVNDAPTIDYSGDRTIVINKGEEAVFSWKVRDIDNLPNELRTIILAKALTRNPWEAFACVGGEEECTQLVDLSPFNTISYNIESRIGCANANELKLKYGDEDQLEDCYAEFTLRFVPQNAMNPYIVFTLTGSDQQEFNGLSSSENVHINVLPINLPPVVWSPPEIESTTSLVNIRDGQNTVNVTDDAPALWEVSLTMTSVSENGHLVIPSIASEKCSENGEYSVECIDTVASINQWIQELRYNITNGDKEAEISFIVNDRGFPGLTDQELLSEKVTTVITINDSILEVPKSSSKLLIIALSVGAAGAIAVGIAVAVLRNKLAPPSDDYFQIGTDTVSTSPQSPLYVGQTKEGFSGLYSGGRA